MKIISFINMKGGVGKSTVAINVAHCLAERNQKKVLIIDIDPQFNATQCIMKAEDYIEHMRTGKDTICSLFSPDRVAAKSVSGPLVEKGKEISKISPVEISDYLHILPGDLGLHRIEVAAGSGQEFKLKRYLDSISDKYDYVIVDTPPTPSIWMSSALIASDYYIIPVKPDPLSRTGIDLLDSIIEDKKGNFDLKIKCAGVVFNMVEENTTVFRETKNFFNNSNTWRNYIFRSFLPKKVAIARRQTSGEHILKTKDSTLHMKLVRVVDEIEERIQ